jgi:murein DD-endopeptidase MepM/ murein hydrolase activator NlpD
LSAIMTAPGRPARILAAALLVLLSACARTYPPAPVVAGNGIAARPGTAAKFEGPRPDSIIVAPGETLYGVARRYDVPIRALIDANNLTPPFQLVTGRQLILPQVRQYIVQQGDTLNAVSRRFGVDVSTLARTNHLAPPYPIQTGQALVLPAPVQTAAASPTTTPDARPPQAAIITEPLAPPPAPVILVPPRGDNATAAAPHPEPPVGSKPAEPAAPAPQIAAVPTPPPPPPSPPVEPPPAPPALPPHTGLGFQWPVRGTVLVGYGPGASGTQNDGINIAAASGTAVAAANDGVVAYAGNELRGFGNLILVKHADGWTTAYAHCETLMVKRGDRVKRGQTIAKVGQTGAVAEPQLHFEIRRGTQPLDPMSYLPPVSTAAAE